MKFAILAMVLVAVSQCAMAQETIVLPAGAELVLRQTYTAGFTCEGRKYGYYADQGNDCQVFHVCVPLADETGTVTETKMYSFFCGNQTTFNQEHLTCDEPGDVDCAAAESYYTVNDLFGIIPPKN